MTVSKTYMSAGLAQTFITEKIMNPETATVIRLNNQNKVAFLSLDLAKRKKQRIDTITAKIHRIES